MSFQVSASSSSWTYLSDERGSNPQPSAWKANTLPIELPSHLNQVNDKTKIFKLKLFQSFVFTISPFFQGGKIRIRTGIIEVSFI